MRARAGRGLVGLVREAKDPNPKKNIEPEHYSKPATLCVDPGAEGDFWGQINPMQGALFMVGETKGKFFNSHL